MLGVFLTEIELGNKASLIFKNYESFQFFRFCLLLANPSRVNLGFGKNVGVEA